MFATLKQYKDSSESIKFGHEIWNWRKGPKVTYVLSFYPRGLKLSLFLLYGQAFLRYGPIFKISSGIVRTIGRKIQDKFENLWLQLVAF